MAIVDVYDALVHYRVYDSALPAEEVLATMQQGRGKPTLDLLPAAPSFPIWKRWTLLASPGLLAICRTPFMGREGGMGGMPSLGAAEGRHVVSPPNMPARRFAL